MFWPCGPSPSSPERLRVCRLQMPHAVMPRRGGSVERQSDDGLRVSSRIFGVSWSSKSSGILAPSVGPRGEHSFETGSERARNHCSRILLSAPPYTSFIPSKPSKILRTSGWGYCGKLILRRIWLTRTVAAAKFTSDQYVNMTSCSLIPVIRKNSYQSRSSSLQAANILSSSSCS